MRSKDYEDYMDDLRNMQRERVLQAKIKMHFAQAEYHEEQGKMCCQELAELVCPYKAGSVVRFMWDGEMEIGRVVTVQGDPDSPYPWVLQVKDDEGDIRTVFPDDIRTED